MTEDRKPVTAEEKEFLRAALPRLDAAIDELQRNPLTDDELEVIDQHGLAFIR